MTEQYKSLEQEVEALITQGFATDERESAEPRVIPVDKYTLPNGEALLRLPDGSAVLLPSGADGKGLNQATVEGSVEHIAASATAPQTPETRVESETAGQAGQGGEVPPAPPVTPVRKVKRSGLLVPLLLLAFLATGIASYVYLLPLTATATVTITPRTKMLRTTTTLTLVAHPQAGQVQGRELAPVSLTADETVSATGHGHQDATRARGVITFYNADSSPFPVPAGMSFATSSGITVITTQAVTIQAAIPPQFGTAIAPAYVVQAGSIGNIPAGAVQTRCCGSVFVMATNTTPFSGGEDERDYSFIQSSDIERAAANMLSQLTPRVSAALQRQVRPGEQLVTPLCIPHVVSSAGAGTQATSVNVAATQTCSSVAYALDSLEQTATTCWPTRQTVSTTSKREPSR
jgi:hypothetical protein